MEPSLRAYREFYRDILPYREHFLAATFRQATQDINGVIIQLNERFQTTFPSLPTDVSTRHALEQRLQGGYANRPGMEIGKTDLPAPQKEEAKAKLRSRLEEPRIKALLHQAESMYDQFLHHTGLSNPALH